MKWVIHTFLIIVSAVLMMSLLPTLSGRWPTPNIVLAAVIVFSLAHDLKVSLLWATFGGLLLDLGQLGHNYQMLSLTLLALGFFYLTTRLIPRPPGYIIAGLALVGAGLMPAQIFLLDHLTRTSFSIWLIATGINLLTILFIFGLSRWPTNSQRHKPLFAF